MKIEIDQLNTILNATFKFAKQKAKEFYFRNWAKNPPVCPAFDGEVVNITREGWEHIIDETSRTRTDVMGRFFVIERAKALLETATTFSEKKIVNRNEHWVFDSVIENVRLRVVVRSIKKQKKHFLTVIKKGTIDEVVSE